MTTEIDSLRAEREQNRKMLRVFEKALAQAERQKRSNTGSQFWIAHCAIPALRENIGVHRRLIDELTAAMERAVWAEWERLDGEVRETHAEMLAADRAD